MLKSLYASVALFFLPAAEDVVKSIQRKAATLDTLTGHLETRIEDKAVALATSRAQRRSAHDAIFNAGHALITGISNTTAALLETIHAAFDRREKAVIAEVDSLMQKAHKAADARAKVEQFLANL